jgi:hypothetical protein
VHLRRDLCVAHRLLGQLLDDGVQQQLRRGVSDRDVGLRVLSVVRRGKLFRALRKRLEQRFRLEQLVGRKLERLCKLWSYLFNVGLRVVREHELRAVGASVRRRRGMPEQFRVLFAVRQRQRLSQQLR